MSIPDPAEPLRLREKAFIGRPTATPEEITQATILRLKLQEAERATRKANTPANRDAAKAATQRLDDLVKDPPR